MSAPVTIRDLKQWDKFIFLAADDGRVYEITEVGNPESYCRPYGNTSTFQIVCFPTELVIRYQDPATQLQLFKI